MISEKNQSNKRIEKASYEHRIKLDGKLPNPSSIDIRCGQTKFEKRSTARTLIQFEKKKCIWIQ